MPPPQGSSCQPADPPVLSSVPHAGEPGAGGRPVPGPYDPRGSRVWPGHLCHRRGPRLRSGRQRTQGEWLTPMGGDWHQGCMLGVKGHGALHGAVCSLRRGSRHPTLGIGPSQETPQAACLQLAAQSQQQHTHPRPPATLPSRFLSLELRSLPRGARQPASPALRDCCFANTVNGSAMAPTSGLFWNIDKEEHRNGSWVGAAPSSSQLAFHPGSRQLLT